VPNAPGEFVIDGGRAPDGDLPSAGLPLTLPDSNFTWANGDRPRTLRRTWLDTFDWRLYRSGLTLELTAGSPAELTLTGRDGELIAALATTDSGDSVRRIRWPALLTALPTGSLRDRLGPVVGVRALLPVARAASRVHERRVLNSDDKTVARITIEQMSVSHPGRATAPQRLSVRPLRGYQAQADRLTAALAAAPGFTAGAQSPLEAALAAAGRRPGDYSGKINVLLTADDPASAALAAVLTALLDTLEANVGGTVRDTDTEFLHDLRIAVRRTRTAVKLAGPALPGRLTARFRPEFKWLGGLTTPTRDLDVYLLGLPAMAAGLQAGTEADLLPFSEHLERRRATAQRQLASGLRSARFARLTDEWRGALGEVARDSRRPTAASLAARLIARARRKMIADGQAITLASPAESLHELRKRGKELRYLLEIFGSLHDQDRQWRAVRELKALQDCLGEFQDTEVQRREIRTFAAQMMDERSAPAATLLAMGEIAAGLAVRQRRARGEFSDRFGAFASAASQARFDALSRAAG
jgi:CHAD domain-containing protein